MEYQCKCLKWYSRTKFRKNYEVWRSLICDFSHNSMISECNLSHITSEFVTFEFRFYSSYHEFRFYSSYHTEIWLFISISMKMQIFLFKWKIIWSIWEKDKSERKSHLKRCDAISEIVTFISVESAIKYFNIHNNFQHYSNNPKILWNVLRFYFVCGSFT